jgi:hypothetical protein
VMADPWWWAGAKMKKLKAADPAAAVVKHPKVMKPRRDLTRIGSSRSSLKSTPACAVRFLTFSHGDQSQGVSCVMSKRDLSAGRP